MKPTSPELGPEFVALVARGEKALERALSSTASGDPERLHAAMRYAALGGGKRLRPLLVYASGQLFDAPLSRLDAPAAAVELIHAYSLVHDDLPAMDNDALRRGQPTCHIAFGEATAILAGDALQALAFHHLAIDPAMDVDASTRLAMLRTLAEACGADGMAGGQALDLAAAGRKIDLQELERLHALKTGALIRACVRLGATAGFASAPDLSALDVYASAFGLAFQIRDDILDVEGASATIGKTPGKDAVQGKPTFPSLLGMEGARNRLVQIIDEALAALVPFGSRAHHLGILARYAAARTT